MRDFPCPVCSNRLFFENDHCAACGAAVAFQASTLSMVAVETAGAPARCGNHLACGCNWTAGDTGPLCLSCGLTETVPPVDDPVHRRRWVDVEAAKRRLVYDLLRRHLAPLPITSPAHPLVFRILVAAEHGGSGKVVMGHEDGLITIDAAEADAAEREGRRERLGEPYRTMLGHVRHETGHYVWDRLFELDGFGPAFRDLFGDERADYAAAMQRHYDQGAPADWQDAHISAYATMHPWEDWAETFAHYLHMMDGLETARTSDLLHGEHLGHDGEDLDAEIGHWIDLSIFMNAMNRSLGHRDAYPFVIAPPVRRKLAFVDDWVSRLAAGEG